MTAADRLTSSAYAERIGDRVWTVTADAVGAHCRKENLSYGRTEFHPP